MVLAALLAPATPAPAQNEPDTPALNRVAAESKLGEVLQEIGRLTAQLEASRTEHRKEQDALRQLDLQIQQVNRDLRALEARRLGHEEELAELEVQRGKYLAGLRQRMDRLAEQLQAAYQGRRQSKLKLVLNQDDPRLLGRMLAYYEYFNRAQVQQISLLREALTRLEVMQQSIDRELERLASLTSEQRALLGHLNGQRQERESLLAELDRQLGNDESRLQELERNRRDLETLIERLTDVLADIPADLGSRVGVEQQKGRLPMPVAGAVKYAYGQSRDGGLSWQGWLIGAEPGRGQRHRTAGLVHAGCGYGLLIIIDHGHGFMSLYGHNESLLLEVGAWVEPGEAISVVGANPGSDQGLYFELRRGGKAIDPAGWLAR
jgi:septal ring factor EnvC (AmiA/AmiB activator)